MAVSTGGGGGGGGGAIRAGRAYVELYARDNATTQIGAIIRRLAGSAGVGLRVASDITSGLGRGMKAVGSTLRGAGAGLFGAGGLAGGLAAKGVLDTLSDVAGMERAAKAFGITSEAASGLFGSLKANGGEFKEDLEGVGQFARKVRDAAAGVGEEPQKLFDGLSVAAKDLVALPLDEQFYRVHDAIMQLNPTLRASKLEMLGGTDSGKKWLALLSTSNAELRGQARSLALSGDEMRQAEAAQKALSVAGQAWTKVLQKTAVALSPALADLAGGVTNVLTPMATWIGQNRGAAVTAAAALTGVTGLGAGLVVLGAVLGAAGTVLTTTGAAIGLLATPVGLAVAGLTGLSAWFLTSTEDGRTLAAELRGEATASVESFSATARTALGGIGDAIKAGDLALAAEIAFAALEVEFLTGTATLTKIWDKFKADLELGGSVLSEALGLPGLQDALDQLKADLAGVEDRQAAAGDRAAEANAGGPGEELQTEWGDTVDLIRNDLAKGLNNQLGWLVENLDDLTLGAMDLRKRAAPFGWKEERAQRDGIIDEIADEEAAARRERLRVAREERDRAQEEADRAAARAKFGPQIDAAAVAGLGAGGPWQALAGAVGEAAAGADRAAGAEGGLARARGRLADLTGQAERKAEAANAKAASAAVKTPQQLGAMVGLGLAGPVGAAMALNPAFADLKRKPPPDPAKLVGSMLSYGGFANTMQEFGGTGGVLKDQLKVQKDIERNTGNQEKAFDRLKESIDELARKMLGDTFS